MTTRSASTTTGLVLLALASLGMARVAGAQVSPYYLTAGDQQHIWVLQGGQIVNDWAADHYKEYPIAVWDDVRTLGEWAPYAGGRYTLAGTSLGASYVFPDIAVTAYDGTTDGAHNYFISYYGASTVYQTDRAWASPTALFSFETSQYLNITFDRLTSSLWIAPFSNVAGPIFNYAMNGTLISSFNTGVAKIAALAMDPVDGTLWFFDNATIGGVTPTFYQYSRDGRLLDTVIRPELQNQNILGGEIGNIPEPATLTLFGTGLLALGTAARRWRSRT